MQIRAFTRQRADKRECKSLGTRQCACDGARLFALRNPEHVYLASGAKCNVTARRFRHLPFLTTFLVNFLSFSLEMEYRIGNLSGDDDDDHDDDDHDDDDHDDDDDVVT